MMKKIIAFPALIFFCVVLYAANPKELPQTVPSSGETVPPVNEKSKGWPLTFHRPMYLLFGNLDDQVKAQLSFKYDPFFAIIDNFGLYLAYTQLMEWRLYDKSSPFRDINFNPEVFWRVESLKNVFGNVDLRLLDYIQLGFFEHKSNGKDGAKSRSWDRSYAEVQISIGKTFNFGMNIKYFVMIIPTIEKNNRNIQNYIGSWEAIVFFKHLKTIDRLGYGELYVRFGAGGGPNGFNFYKGWQEYGIIFPSILARIRPYIQAFHGYGEFLLDYNVKRTNTWGGTLLHGTGTAIRIGVILE
jgi:phospholipase A1/A2